MASAQAAPDVRPIVPAIEYSALTPEIPGTTRHSASMRINDKTSASMTVGHYKRKAYNGGVVYVLKRNKHMFYALFERPLSKYHGAFAVA